MTCQSWAALRECARVGSEPEGVLLDHVRSCPQCESRFERERALSVQFSGLRQATRGSRSSSVRHAELMRKFQALERPRRLIRWPVAIAAMLLAGVALGTWQSRSRVDISENIADAEEYTAVPYAVPLATGEFVRVLHADLPASSLVQMGLDLDGDSVDAIPVDLVVGQDDLPRAVRISRSDF